VQELFEAIRRACGANTWSRGVELARDGCVAGDAGSDGDGRDELRLSVRVPGRTVAASTVLYPDDEEWECDCGSAAEACEHVAAAVIAVRRARQRGEPLAAASAAPAPGRLRHSLARTLGGGLEFEREIVVPGDGGESVHLLTTTLDAIAKGRVDGPPFAATQADLAVELALGARRRGALDEPMLRRLAEPLSRCEDVRLDGAPIRVSSEPLRPIVVVEDAGPGFRARLAEPAGVDERFDALGFARRGDVLHPLGASGLTGRELQDLTAGLVFSPDDAVRLAAEFVPSFDGRIEVELRTARLPRTTKAAVPRLRVETERRGDALSVLATLVYGDPPVARIDAGKLVSLGGGAIPVRDLAAERAATDRLARELGLAPGRRVDLSGTDALALAARLEDFSGTIAGRAHEAFFETAPLSARFEIDEARFDVAFELPESDGRAARVDARSVIAAWQRGDASVALAGGGFAPLPRDWLARYGARVADLLAARDARGELAACALPDLARLCDELDIARPLALDRLRPLLDDFRGIPRTELPTDLTAELRAYQRAGVDWLAFLRDAELGALLADDMGLGKTLQTLCALRGRALVVAPTSVLGNWRDEAARFRPSLRVRTYHGPARALDPQADLTLTSYAILRLDADVLARARWDAVVLDEAQQIKNPESQAARAAFELRAKQRIALTGTPVENRLDELWSLLHFTNPGLLGGRGDFRERTARPIESGDAAASERLRERIRPFVLRRHKRDVASELPARTDVVLRFALSDEERAVYDSVRAAGLAEALAALRGGGSVMPALEVVLRLRQAACDAALVPGIADAPASSKLEMLVARLEEARDDDHRALVFSQWTSLLDRIGAALDAAGIPWLRLDGSTRDRDDVVARFQAGEAPVFLVSLRAGGTGLNLTAADHVFLVDPWWNPAVEQQAADRAHRIGQTRPVVVHRLVAQDTIEERILALHESKRALALAALGEGRDDATAAGLTREDLLALLD